MDGRPEILPWAPPSRSVQPSRPPPGRAHPPLPPWLGRVQGEGTTGLSQLGPVTAWTEGGIHGPGGISELAQTHVH